MLNLGSSFVKVLKYSKVKSVEASADEIPSQTKNIDIDCGQKHKQVIIRKKKEMRNKITRNINVKSFDKKEKNSEIIIRRCAGCHLNHFPHPKFCRWWETRITLKEHNQTGPLPYDIHLIKKGIEILEGKLHWGKSCRANECMNRFFNRSEDSCHSNEFPDLFNLKLRGGGTNHRVAVKSKNRLLDCVLSLFRDIEILWRSNEMKSHPLCDHKLQPNCFYCLPRSLSLRSMNPKVRTPISALEVFKYLENENIENMELQDMVKSIMDLLVLSENNF